MDKLDQMVIRLLGMKHRIACLNRFLRAPARTRKFRLVSRRPVMWKKKKNHTLINVRQIMNRSQALGEALDKAVRARPILVKFTLAKPK